MEKVAFEIVEKLQSAGFGAYFAGGFVRDRHLGRRVADIDIATSAKPREVERLFKKTIPIGKQFGIIAVVEGGHSFEVATFREEGEYLDFRRPAKINFAGAEEDAKRRDFTINALFYDPVRQKTIDFIGGVEDLKKKTIRFVGDPQERIGEDHLRLLRAIRLKIILGFQYDPGTFKAVRQNAHLIKTVSTERVRDELNKIFASPERHRGLIELSESGLLANILPELEELKGQAQPREYHGEGDVFTHIYLALKALPDDASLHLAWATLLHDIAKPRTEIKEKGRIIFHDHAKISGEMAEDILKRLKFSRLEVYAICWLVSNHMRVGDIDKMRPLKAYEFVSDPKFKDLIRLTRADSLGTYPQNLDFVGELERKAASAERFRQRAQATKTAKIITGDDLIALGFEPSDIFSKILEEVEERNLQGKIKTKAQALAFVKKKYTREKNG